MPSAKSTEAARSIKSAANDDEAGSGSDSEEELSSDYDEEDEGEDGASDSDGDDLDEDGDDDDVDLGEQDPAKRRSALEFLVNVSIHRRYRKMPHKHWRSR